MVSAPCKDCTARFVGCHSFCEGYKKFKEEHTLEKEVINKQKLIETQHINYVIERKESARRSHNRRN